MAEVTNQTGRAAGDDTGIFPLRILATSDLHAHVMPYDYAADRPLHGAGLTRTAHLIRAARAEVANCLTIDNGDFLEGSPLGEMIASHGAFGPGEIHPVIAAMNAVGYDAAALGNHEFSYGVDFLLRALQGADFPFLCANAVTRLGTGPLTDDHLCPPVLLLDRWLQDQAGAQAAIRIGLIGLLPPQIDIWEQKHLAGRILTRDILETADVWVPKLKAMGADLVIALCHSGIGGGVRESRMENAAVPLARIDGVDVLIAGHTHLRFPGPDIPPCADVDPALGTICGKPAVMAGFWGSHLGIVDLDLHQADGLWQVLGARSSLRAITRPERGGPTAPPCLPNDPAVEGAVAAAHRATVDFVRQPIGRTDLALHSYFAQVTDSAALALIHAAQLDWLATALAGTAQATLPMLSAASPFKSGDRGGPDHFTDIAAGALYLRSLYDVYMYPNAIRALRITGADLADWLERAASRFLQLRAWVTDQPLLDPDAPAYNFDVIAGVTYDFDLSGPARYGAHGALLNPGASRVRNLRHRDQPIRPDAQFAIATNNFRAAGGGGYPVTDRTVVLHAPLTPIADVLKSYVLGRSTVCPEPAHGWRLTGLPPGTAAWFDTGPGALRHLPAQTTPRIEAIGETPAGFLRCRLWL